MAISADQANSVLERADLLIPKEEILAALDRMGIEITQSLAEKNPLILVLMNGGLIPAAELLLRLRFPLEVDYLHATRYGDETQGNQLTWVAKAKKPMAGRTVLVIDDILDEGKTLSEILRYCREEDVKELYSAVLVEKQHERKFEITRADFTGVEVPDRYVFGCGMDYKGYWRNLPEIYAAHKDDE